ncbi:MAG TPA: DUF454 domain-containing protein [Leptospiraceae bacterium]|nr:hypothetical protein [Spirochaetaceae bacterium]HBS04460.1 DUF454 domain-containing protein [Leptospiraceae bacterium]|tara:strand:- start:2561 stop:3007 length:447 start_codon:yes stop_codon:yes gene_type:complete
MEKKNQLEWIDYSHRMRLHNSPVLRALFWVAGSLSLVLGILGIFLPILPTTPFLLLTAYLYTRSSERFYNWLMNHAYLGPYIRQWVEHRTLTLRTKFSALGLLTVTIVSSNVFFVEFPVAHVLMALTGILVGTYILHFKTLEIERKPR